MKPVYTRLLLSVVIIVCFAFAGTTYSQSREFGPNAIADSTSDASNTNEQPSDSNTENLSDDTQTDEAEKVLTEIELLQQALNNFRLEIETGQTTTNQNRFDIESIRSDLNDINNKLLDVNKRLTESEANVDTDSDALGDLNAAFQMLATNNRANVAELGVQKSLIEDNAVRLFEILIKVRALEQQSSNIVSSLRINNESEQDEDAAEQYSPGTNTLYTLLLVSVSFLMILAYTHSNSRGKSLRLSDGLSHQQGALPVALISMLGFLVIGFGLMYGDSASGLIGLSSYLFEDGSSLTELPVSYFDYQLGQNAYIILASLVVYTAINKQLSMLSHFILAVFVSVLLIPIFGHWAWSGNFEPNNLGWLENRGFSDQTGAVLIHLIPACFALVITFLRRKKLPLQQNSSASQSEFQIYTTTSIVLLWVSLLVVMISELLLLREPISPVILNVNIAAIMGGIVSILYRCFFSSQGKLTLISFSGFICGLIAISSCAHVVTVPEAAAIGAVAGILLFVTVRLIRKYILNKKYQVTGIYIIAIHATGGLWGALCIALFGSDGHFSAPNTHDLSVQSQGVGIAIVYSIAMAMPVALVLKFTGSSHEPK